MPGQVRAQVLHIAEFERIAFAFELLNDPRLVCNGLRDDRIGDELVGNHGLFLVDAALSEPKDASRGTENAIDAGLWEDSENLISYLAIYISLSLCLSVSLSLCLYSLYS